MKKIYLLFIFFILTGCTTAGPFVTNISRHTDGTLTVEKCLVEYTGFGTLSNKNCTVSKI